MTLACEAIEVRLGERTVLENVTVGFASGRISGLVGPNGAGKSTLMRVAAGLVTPTRGRVLLDGADVTHLPRRERGRKISFLPQQRTVHWPLQAEAVVKLGRLPHQGLRDGSEGGDADRRAVAQAMADMDVAGLAHRAVNELSGGELARVLVARALAQEAPVILADEPTAGLDPAHALGLFQVLERLAADGRTIVVALHDLSLAARFCHDVVMLGGGRVAAAGPAGDVLTTERLAPVFGATMAVGMLGGVPAVVPVDARR